MRSYGGTVIIALANMTTIPCLVMCEEVTAGQIWDQMVRGCTELIELKPSRLAMGHCQGRMCEPIAAEMLRLKGVLSQTIEPLRVRPPLSPIPISALEDYLNGNEDRAVNFQQ